MAGYRVKLTVYKDPTGKTIKGPTFVHFLGDLCSGLGLISILGTILAVMEQYGAGPIIGGIAVAVAGFALMAVLHKKAKKDAEKATLKVLARYEGQAADSGKSN